MLRITRSQLIALSCLLLAGCGQPEESSTRTLPQVHLYKVEQQQTDQQRLFIGRVDAISSVDMAFEVPGRLQQLPAREGELVAEGQLLAALDATDYQLALREAEVAQRQAQRELERGRQLRAGNHLSQADLDQLQTRAEQAALAEEKARRNLSHSRLQAPFDALVSRRLEEAFSTVNAMQPVIRVQNVSELRIHISVPELFMRQFTGQPGDYQASLLLPEALLNSDAAGLPLTLAYREHSTEADPVTQTYQVSFGLQRPDHIQLLPGMTLAVAVSQRNQKHSRWVPLSALDTSEPERFSVWRYDPDSGQVNRQPVSIGSLRDGEAQITAGLAGGEQLVAAGIRQLEEGQQVAPFSDY